METSPQQGRPSMPAGTYLFLQYPNNVLRVAVKAGGTRQGSIELFLAFVLRSDSTNNNLEKRLASCSGYCTPANMDPASKSLQTRLGWNASSSKPKNKSIRAGLVILAELLL